MTDVHRIRLQSAWDHSSGGTTWIRSFGRPSGVGPRDRVWLVIDRPAACAVALNGRCLPAAAGDQATWRHDVTAGLRTRNEVRLEFGSPVADAAPGHGPLPETLGLVRLEIESER